MFKARFQRHSGGYEQFKEDTLQDVEDLFSGTRWTRPGVHGTTTVIRVPGQDLTSSCKVTDDAGNVVIARDKHGVWTGIGAEAANQAELELITDEEDRAWFEAQIKDIKG